jgi:hypothetical protein
VFAAVPAAAELRTSSKFFRMPVHSLLLSSTMCRSD